MRKARRTYVDALLTQDVSWFDAGDTGDVAEAAYAAWKAEFQRHALCRRRHDGGCHLQPLFR